MKKYTLLAILGLCLGTVVFKASNDGKIEKLITLVVVDEDLSLVPSSPLNLIANDLSIKMEYLIPETIIIEPIGCSYVDWKPFGEVRTKYHAKWLFNPVKLC